jgi:hypothetical protein
MSVLDGQTSISSIENGRLFWGYAGRVYAQSTFLSSTFLSRCCLITMLLPSGGGRRPPALHAPAVNSSGIPQMWSVIPSCINGVAVIAREKEIKGWRRSKKIKLIESTNPHWHLPADWQKVYKLKLTRTAREIPRPAGESAGLRDDAP